MNTNAGEFIARLEDRRGKEEEGRGRRVRKRTTSERTIRDWWLEQDAYKSVESIELSRSWTKDRAGERWIELKRVKVMVKVVTRVNLQQY